MLAERTWHGLLASRWSEPRALRLWVSAAPYVNVPLFAATYPPARLMTVIEDLRREQQIGREQATQLEDLLLQATQKTGHWKPVPTL